MSVRFKTLLRQIHVAFIPPFYFTVNSSDVVLALSLF